MQMNPAERTWPSYAVILPARNEAHVIRFALESMVRQTLPPKALVVALNDCTDGTAEIVEPYLRKFPWISLYHHDFHGTRNYSKKALVFTEAFSHIAHLNPDFVGNLDADVSLPSDYYQRVLERFASEPRLGIAGGVFFEIRNGVETRNFDLYTGSVVGMIQLFKMECYRNIGGYRPVTTGGVDMAADTMARFHGWTTRSFQDIRFQHHRPLGTAESNPLRAKYKEGVRDFHMGYGFLFHLLKCIRRIPEQPFLIGSLARLAAFCAGYLGNAPMALEPAEREFLRTEQRRRIKALVRSLPSSIMGSMLGRKRQWMR